MRRVGAVVLCLLVAASCRTRLYEGKYTMTHDSVLWDFGRKVDLFSTALMAAPGGGYLILWTDRDGMWSLLLDSKSRPVGEPVMVADVWAGRMTATDLGGLCEPSGARYAVSLAPRVSVLDGRGDLVVLLLDEQGRMTSRLTMTGEVGPYSSGMNMSGDCDGLLVAWHRGAIGRFESRLAMVDVRTMDARWVQTVSAGGVNGFCPALLSARGGTHVLWGEIRVAMREPGDDDDPGRIVHAIVGDGGDLVRKPHPVIETLRAHVPASMVQRGDRIGVLYKDFPTNEDREGIYLAFLDSSGSLVDPPRRIARGDGPDPALLLPLEASHLATAAVRSLSNELLIGLNFLDERGLKRAGEMQIYAHQVRFRRLTAIPRQDEIVLLYVEQGLSGSRLLMTRVSRVS